MKLGEVTVTSLLGNYSPGTVRALTKQSRYNEKSCQNSYLWHRIINSFPRMHNISVWPRTSPNPPVINQF